MSSMPGGRPGRELSIASGEELALMMKSQHGRHQSTNVRRRSTADVEVAASSRQFYQGRVRSPARQSTRSVGPRLPSIATALLICRHLRTDRVARPLGSPRRHR